jgi:hypothetical protein
MRLLSVSSLNVDPCTNEFHILELLYMVALLRSLSPFMVRTSVRLIVPTNYCASHKAGSKVNFQQFTLFHTYNKWHMFQVFTAVKIMSRGFWDVTQYQMNMLPSSRYLEHESELFRFIFNSHISLRLILILSSHLPIFHVAISYKFQQKTKRFRSQMNKIEYRLTLWNKVVFWEVNSCSASKEIPRVLWVPNVHCRVHTSPPLFHILSPMDPVDTHPILFH